jgi:uncharacterized membrane protein
MTLAAVVSPVVAEEEITITDLGTLGGGSSYARGINDLGPVVGNSYTATGVQHATLWTVPVPVVTPEQAIAGAVEDVAALLTDGALDDSEANALTSKLEAAQFQLDKGNTKASTNVIGACTDQVEAMVNSGRLTAEKAQPLIDAVNNAIELIEAEP